MAATPGDRRTPGRRPGRPSGSRPSTAGRPERKRAERDRVAQVAQVRAEEQHRSRLTGRAAILVLVLAVLAVSYASSLRAYLQQREKIDAVERVIDEKQSSIDDLQSATERSDDPDFITLRARELGYVKPGETPYVAIGEDGPLTDSALDDPSTVGQPDEEPAWFDGVWESVKVAGHPPTKIPPPPAKRIVGSEDE